MRLVLPLAALLFASLPGRANTEPASQSVATSGQQMSGLFVYGDTVNGNEGRLNCVLQSRFAPGDRLVFRAKVVDAQSGQLVPTATATIRFADGATLPMRYAPHPPPYIGPATDEYWTAVWVVPADAPLGIIRYTIEATDGTRSGNFEPFNLEFSLLTIVPQP